MNTIKAPTWDKKSSKATTSRKHGLSIKIGLLFMLLAGFMTLTATPVYAHDGTTDNESKHGNGTPTATHGHCNADGTPMSSDERENSDDGGYRAGSVCPGLTSEPRGESTLANTVGGALAVALRWGRFIVAAMVIWRVIKLWQGKDKGGIGSGGDNVQIKQILLILLAGGLIIGLMSSDTIRLLTNFGTSAEAELEANQNLGTREGGSQFANIIKGTP